MREIKFKVLMSDGTFVCLDIFEIVGWMPNKKPERFLEYTGLLDKNRKEIYEEDIVKFIGKGYRNSIGVIIYADEKGTAGYAIKGNFVFAYLDCEIKDIEIIGNIYENPKLLEVK